MTSNVMSRRSGCEFRISGPSKVNGAANTPDAYGTYDKEALMDIYIAARLRRAPSLSFISPRRTNAVGMTR